MRWVRAISFRQVVLEIVDSEYSLGKVTSGNVDKIFNAPYKVARSPLVLER